jgi:hypothetical protein
MSEFKPNLKPCLECEDDDCCDTRGYDKHIQSLESSLAAANKRVSCLENVLVAAEAYKNVMRDHSACSDETMAIESRLDEALAAAKSEVK